LTVLLTACSFRCMVMRKVPPAADPDAYHSALRGWQRACVTKLRAAVRRAGALDEVIKWGNLVYLGCGPVALIRAEETRVLLGLWRGKRLTDVEPSLKPSGKYEMATIHIVEGTPIRPAMVTRLIREALVLNRTLGDPTKDAPKRPSRRKPAAKRVRPAGHPAPKKRGR
jgi:hypothetical protein